MNRIADHFMTWFVGLFLLVAGGIGSIALKPLIATWSYEPVSGVIVQSKMEYCGMELSGYSDEIRFAYTVGDREYFDGRLPLNTSSYSWGHSLSALLRACMWRS